MCLSDRHVPKCIPKRAFDEVRDAFQMSRQQRHVAPKRWLMRSRIMEYRNLRRLPVMNSDKMIGIVTQSDLLPVIARLVLNAQSFAQDDERIRGAVVSGVKRIENRLWTMPDYPTAEEAAKAFGGEALAPDE